ncbi:MAG: N-acetylmuramoyl-L-alanine amidase [Cyanobacteria bacterium SZAS LIN-3]|nr:N-acetylmuramoyl-L-alanine amidase [Cyanobacteria bacterium SZAS LIN-3]
MTKHQILLGVFLLGLTIALDSSAGTTQSLADQSCNPPAKQEPAPKPKPALAGRRILVDAGHGGTDPGAMRAGVEEKDITLDVSLKLRARLENLGARVDMTRDSDVFIPLPDRLAASNTSCPDLFVSVHVNAVSKPSITGIETYYYDDRGQNLANVVLNTVSSQLHETAKWSHSRDLFVLDGNRVPATLAEIGYITNPGTRAKLNNPAYQDKVASALADSVVTYLESPGAEHGCSV